MNLKRSSASRGELTKAMSATLREVRLHHQQIAAALAGIQQLMDGQAALGESFEALKKRVDELEASRPNADKAIKILNEKFAGHGELRGETPKDWILMNG